MPKRKLCAGVLLRSVGDEWEVGIHAVGVSRWCWQLLHAAVIPRAVCYTSTGLFQGQHLSGIFLLELISDAALCLNFFCTAGAVRARLDRNYKPADLGD